MENLCRLLIPTDLDGQCKVGARVEVRVVQGTGTEEMSSLTAVEALVDGLHICKS